VTLEYIVDPSTALIKGYDRFAFSLTNWGNGGASGDPQSLDTGLQNFSLAGIAIHPNSDLDTFAVQSNAWGIASQQIVTPEAPFIGDIPGPWRGRSVPMQRFDDAYYPVGTSVSTPFGFAMGNDPNGVPIFGGTSGDDVTPVYPKLQLIAYLRPPTNVPTALGPISESPSQMIVPAGTNVVRVLAISGRKRLRVLFKRSTHAGSCDVQLTAAQSPWTGLTPTFEFDLTTAQTMAAPSGEAVFDLVVPPNVQWLFIKTTLNSGAPRIYWRLLAY